MKRWAILEMGGGGGCRFLECLHKKDYSIWESILGFVQGWGFGVFTLSPKPYLFRI